MCDLCCRYFDFEKLREVTRVVAKNLNKIIDINYYPAETARRSNMRHRPIGIGVQVCLPSVLQVSVSYADVACLGSRQARTVGLPKPPGVGVENAHKTSILSAHKALLRTISL